MSSEERARSGANSGDERSREEPEGTVSEVAGGPALRVVRGHPDPEEIAAVTAVISASSRDEMPARVAPTGGWSAPERVMRRMQRPGPGAWVASGRR